MLRLDERAVPQAPHIRRWAGQAGQVPIARRRLRCGKQAMSSCSIRRLGPPSHFVGPRRIVKLPACCVRRVDTLRLRAPSALRLGQRDSPDAFGLGFASEQRL